MTLGFSLFSSHFFLPQVKYVYLNIHEKFHGGGKKNHTFPQKKKGF